MFDYIVCEASLPETPTPPPHGLFQTKDTPDQYMTKYTITAEGRLMWRPYEIEEVPKAERPNPNDEGLLGLRGALRRVEADPEYIEYHGDINFYTSEDRGDGWWEYRARFTDGQLSSIKLVEYKPQRGGSHEPA